MTHLKHARTDHEVLDLIRHRWSPRAFDPARDVSRDALVRLFEAARWAPSSANAQPWRFVLANRVESPEAFRAVVSVMTAKNQTWAMSAPVMVLVAVRTTHESSGVPNTHAWYDTGQAVGFLTLQATEMGLSIRQVAGFDREQARAVCAVPAPFEPAVLIAVGYAGDPSALSVPMHRETEMQPRERRRVGEFVFKDTWGMPL